MSAHTHVYRYPLVESGMKTGVRVIALCRKDRVLLSKHKAKQKRLGCKKGEANQKQQSSDYIIYMRLKTLISTKAKN